MNTILIRHLYLFVLLLSALPAVSQTDPGKKNKISLFDGIIAAGYVDKGAYVNCTGPSVKFTRKPLTLMLGLLPGLRIKEDKIAAGAPKNSVVTPSLGFGLTLAIGHLVVQTPFYYTSKTSSKDGKWNPGVGLGYRF